MSKVVTPPQSHTQSPSTPTTKVAHDKIAMRAYEKWCQRGCQHGSAEKDWLEAEKELRGEMTRGGNTTTHRH